MIAKGIQADGVFGHDALFYLENNTNQNITIQCRDASANGFMVDPIFSLGISSGAKAVDNMTFSSSDLERNGIERIENLEFKLFVFNTDTWDTIFESDIIAFTPEYIS